MSEQPRLTVTLPHDQWQWVMSLLMNSSWLRADPIVKAVEAAVKAHAAGLQFEADSLKTQAENAQMVIRRHEMELSSLHSELKQRNETIKHLEARIRGYQSKAAQAKRAAQQAKSANGHDAEPADPPPFPATEPGESFVDKVLEAATVPPDEDEP